MITADEIVTALRQLGGEADVADIRHRVIENRGGTHGYQDDRSCHMTIQRKIEDHCEERLGYKGPRLFEAVERGRYRLTG